MASLKAYMREVSSLCDALKVVLRKSRKLVLRVWLSWRCVHNVLWVMALCGVEEECSSVSSVNALPDRTLS